jgi:hypothetical protein
LRQQRLEQPENVRPLFRGDTKLDDRWPLAPGTCDGLCAEAREHTIGVKRERLRPTRTGMNLAMDDLAPHLGAIALAQREHGLGRARHSFKSHGSQE